MNDVKLAESNDTLIVNKKRQGAGDGCTIYIRQWSRTGADEMGFILGTGAIQFPRRKKYINSLEQISDYQKS